MLLEDNVTAIPAAGAGPLSVTVPVEVEPPTTDVGDTDMLDSVGGLIVRVDVFDTDPTVPVIVAVVEL